MQNIVVQYKKKEITIPEARTYQDIALFLKRNDALVCEIDGVLTDLNAKVVQSSFSIDFYNFDHEKGKETYWHTGAHILAQAVKRLFPHALYTIGPAIEKGFYYDFDMGEYHFTPEDIEKIEGEIKKIIEANYPVVRKEVSKKEALEIFKDNLYKQEILQELDDNQTISLYSQGEFVDLCRGPHLSSTGLVKELKIISLAGAYWRGDSNNKMLQRLYGIAFPSSKEMQAYLKFLEEAKKRDHRKIGKEMDLFSFHEEGPGFPFWHEKGTILFNLLVEYMREENKKRGYTEIKTPPILSDVLWKRSGHWDNYKNNMYFTEIDERSFAIKPMNCPGGLLVYNTRLHSYRELPIRQAEFGLVHRHELSGVLHGLFRVRSFTQDDAHIFCTEEQLLSEIQNTVRYVMDVYQVMGFEEIKVFIATRPEKSIGSDHHWEIATQALSQALKELNIDYQLKEGEGAFYGPKIEFNIKDCLGRNWQCGTIQVDFSMPERFDLTYEGSDGKKHRPIMVHRAILGSLERFIGILLEHYEGKLPAWLAPVQVKIINVAEKHIPTCEAIKKKLEDSRIRVEADFRNETLGYKIRDARNQRVPFMIIIGDKEEESRKIAVRGRDNQTLEMTVEQLVELCQKR